MPATTTMTAVAKAARDRVQALFVPTASSARTS
jgi:hypothetical protein